MGEMYGSGSAPNCPTADPVNNLPRRVAQPQTAHSADQAKTPCPLVNSYKCGSPTAPGLSTDAERRLLELAAATA